MCRRVSPYLGHVTFVLCEEPAWGETTKRCMQKCEDPVCGELPYEDTTAFSPYSAPASAWNCASVVGCIAMFRFMPALTTALEKEL